MSKVKVTKKREGRNHSIRFYIIAIISFLTVITISALWIFQGIFLNSAFMLAKKSDVERASSLIADNYNSEDISSLISQVCAEYDICVKTINMNTGAEYDEHFVNNCILHKITGYGSLVQGWYEEAILNDGEYTIAMSYDAFNSFADSEQLQDISDGESSEENCVISIKIVKDKNDVEHMIIINGYMDPMPGAMSVIRIILAIVSILICVFSVIISYILSKKISKPIERVTKAAKELQGGDYNVRFEESGPIEVVELAKTLNSTNVQLERVDKLQKELIANISHDLRTPLTMISGYSEFMRDFPDEVSPENMQVIIDETARLNSLVNDLLDVSKLQSGKQTINMQKISLTNTIQSTVKRYDKLTSHNDYHVSFIHDCEVFVEADETRLLQVIYNLVNNAINYTGEDKTVTIRQDVLDNIVRISIIDTGEGISEENLPLVWDRYYKIDKVHKRAILGTGLGLSIVKHVLLLHNSRFGVSSEVGKGSTFWFELKIVDKAY